MEIEVLGSGCKNCNALESVPAEALQRLGLDQPISKITDYAQIASYGVMSTPALAINGDVKITGRLPTVDEITRIIQAANA